MFKKYKPFFKAGAINAFAYKAAILTWFIITIVEVACTVFLWYAVFNNSSEAVINGFTFNQIIVYFVETNIVSFVCFGGETLWLISNEIKEGKIANELIKPISLRGRMLMTTLGIVGMHMLIIGLPLITISLVVFYAIGFLTFTSIGALLFSIFSFAILVTLSIILFDAVDYFFGVCCFYTTSAWGINLTKNVIVSFLGGAALPVSFFKFGDVDLSVVINYLPFAGMVQNPVLALTTTYSSPVQYLHVVHTIGLAIVWIIIIEVINHLFFNHAIKKVTVQGG